MNDGIWVAIITVGGGLLTAIATGIAAGLVQIVHMLLDQSKKTIDILQADRDYWRSRALCDDEQQEAEE